MAELVLNTEFHKIHDRAVPVFFRKSGEPEIHVGWAFHDERFSLEAISNKADGTVGIYVQWEGGDRLVGTVKDWEDAKSHLEELLQDLDA